MESGNSIENFEINLCQPDTLFKEHFMKMQYPLRCFLFYSVVESLFFKDVLNLSLRILHKNYSFRSLFKNNFLKFLLQSHNILAYVKHDLPDNILADFSFFFMFAFFREFSDKFLNV